MSFNTSCNGSLDYSIYNYSCPFSHQILVHRWEGRSGMLTSYCNCHFTTPPMNFIIILSSKSMLMLHSTPLALKTSVRKSIGSQYLVLLGDKSIYIMFYINMINCKYYFMINYRMNTTKSIHYFISMLFKFFIR